MEVDVLGFGLTQCSVEEENENLRSEGWAPERIEVSRKKFRREMSR